MIYLKTVNEIKRDQIMVTLEEAILTVNQLPLEQREMLLEIIKNHIDIDILLEHIMISSWPSRDITSNH